MQSQLKIGLKEYKLIPASNLPLYIFLFFYFLFFFNEFRGMIQKQNPDHSLCVLGLHKACD